MLHLAPLQHVAPVLRIEALREALRACGPDEADELVNALTRGSRGRRRFQALAAAAVAWDRISPETQHTVLRYAGRRLSVLVEDLSNSNDPRERKAAARLLARTGEPTASGEVLERLLLDDSAPVAGAATDALLGTGERRSDSVWSGESLRLLLLCAERYGVHRRREALEAVVSLAATGAPDAMRAWLADDGQAAHMALRSVIRRDERPQARERAFALLGYPSLSPACVDRLRRDDAPAEHDAALRRFALLENPKRRRALSRATDASQLLPRETAIAELSAPARLGRVRLVRALRLTGPERAAALAPCLTDDTDVVRGAAVAALSAGARTDAELGLMLDFVWDRSARVAASAAAALLCEREGPARREVWARIASKATEPARAIAAIALADDPLASPVAARLALGADRRSYVASLRAAIASGERAARCAAIGLAHRLGVEADVELELLGAAADGDARIASAAARALGAVTSRSAAQALERLTGHVDARVRANALEATDSRRAPVELFEAKLGDPHHRVRSAAIVALADAAPGIAPDAAGAMLRSEKEQDRIAALWAVSRTRMADAAPDVATCASAARSLHERRWAARCARRLLHTEHHTAPERSALEAAA